MFFEEIERFHWTFSRRTDRRRRFAPRRQNLLGSVSFRMKKQHPRQNYHAEDGVRWKKKKIRWIFFPLNRPTKPVRARRP